MKDSDRKDVPLDVYDPRPGAVYTFGVPASPGARERVEDLIGEFNEVLQRDGGRDLLFQEKHRLQEVIPEIQRDLDDIEGLIERAEAEAVQHGVSKPLKGKRHDIEQDDGTVTTVWTAAEWVGARLEGTSAEVLLKQRETKQELLERAKFKLDVLAWFLERVTVLGEPLPLGESKRDSSGNTPLSTVAGTDVVIRTETQREHCEEVVEAHKGNWEEIESIKDLMRYASEASVKAVQRVLREADIPYEHGNPQSLADAAGEALRQDATRSA